MTPASQRELVLSSGYVATGILAPAFSGMVLPPQAKLCPEQAFTSVQGLGANRTKEMGRDGWRVKLENGLKLDLNRLARRGFIRPGAITGPTGITWTNSYWGHVGSALISADMSGSTEGSFRIQFSEWDQRIILLRRPRNFGGGQWYFVCPVMNRRASVLWKPPGAKRFCSRQAWGRQVAYHSQFLSPTDRVWNAKTKMNRRLCEIGGFDSDDWDFPPKPKWMRHRTYDRLNERFHNLESQLDDQIDCALKRLERVWKNL